MAFYRWQRNIVDEAGNVLDGAQVEIRNELTGLLVNLYEDIDGVTPKGNPLTADSSGYVFAYLEPARLKITATSGSFSFSLRDVLLPEGPLAGDLSNGFGAFLVNGATIYVGSVAELEALPTAGLVDGQAFDVEGGKFTYNAVTDAFDPEGPIPINAFGPINADGITNDYATFNLAGVWLELDPGRRVSLTTGKTYYLSYTGNLFFNGIEGNGADVIIDAGGFLAHDRLSSNDVFYLNNLDIYKAGDRSGVLDASSNRLYIEGAASTLVDVFCKNVNVYGILDPADKASWSDDIGETRFGQFIRLRSTNSHFENVQSFGIGLTINLRSVSGGRHFERNIKGYNCETALWIIADDYDVDVYDYGDTSSVSIINTIAQKSYWIGRDNGIDANGKDPLLVNTQHLRYDVTAISETNAIERSAYLRGNNTNLSGVFCNGGLNAFDIKDTVSLLADLRKNNTASNIRCVDIEDGGAGACNFYGQENIDISDFSIAANSSLGRAAFQLSDGINGAIVSNGSVRNLGSIVNLQKLTGDLLVSDVTISNIVAKNVHNGTSSVGTLLNSTVSVGERIQGIRLHNIAHDVDNPINSKFARAAYYLENADDIELNKVDGWCAWYPFRFDNCTNITVKNSLFNIATDQSASGFITRLLGEPRFSANHFDFKLSCNNLIEAIPTTVLMRCVGDSSSLVNCSDHWQEITLTIDVPDNTTFFIDIPVGADYSFDLSATIGDNQLVLSNDGSGAGTSTQIRNSGTRLSHTTSATAIRVYNNGSGNIIARTENATFTGGQLKIVMTR